MGKLDLAPFSVLQYINTRGLILNLLGDTGNGTVIAVAVGKWEIRRDDLGHIPITPCLRA
jgi:hypothetical protein